MGKFDGKYDYLEPHEVFISYRRQYGWQTAFLISNLLEAKGITTFYDRKNLGNRVIEEIDWKEAIQYNIQRCEVFIFIISGKSLFYCGGRKDPYSHEWPNNDNMWDEYEYVHDYNKKCDEEGRQKDKIKVVYIIEKDFIPPAARELRPGETEEDVGVWGKTEEQKKKYKEYYESIKRIHFNEIDAHNAYRILTTEYIPQIEQFIINKHRKTEKDKINKFYSHSESQKESDAKEAKRLEEQTNNDLPSLKPVICEKILMFKEQYVLDVGCANGYKTNKLFGQYPTVKYLLGVDSSEDYIKAAQDKYARKNDCQEFEFKQCNILKNNGEDFENILAQSFKKTKHKFNIVFISYLLLHVNNHEQIIDTISRYMETGGVIVIQEAEDSFAITYVTNIMSDKLNADIDRFNQIFEHTQDNGNRHMGRELFGLLFKDFESFKIESIYGDEWCGAYGIETAREIYDETLEGLKNNLKDETIRISEWTEKLHDKKWLEDEKTRESIIKTMIDDSYFGLVPQLIVSAVKK